VQEVEVMFVEEFSWVFSDFYTEFSTAVLKSFVSQHKKAAPMSGFRFRFRQKD
jgi:hypothetical protein